MTCDAVSNKNGNGQAAMVQPVLLNNLIQPNGSNDLNHVVLVANNNSQSNSEVFSLAETQQNGSSLRIDKVFQNVDDNFADNISAKSNPPATYDLLPNLLRQKPNSASNVKLPTGVAFKRITQLRPSQIPSRQQPPTIQSDLSRLENLIQTVEQQESIQTIDAPASTANQLNIVNETTTEGADYRCNMCLAFNDDFDMFKQHMKVKHRAVFVCDVCHLSFLSKTPFDIHKFTKQCDVSKINSLRKFTTLIDPPIVLMKNNIRAFKCKHCSFAYYNQKNYCHHAQRHATHFRCKSFECSSLSPMTAHAMSAHLLLHN